jgi:hypothetical protein
MADNSSVPVASGNETFANDDIGGVKYPRPKINWGPDGTANEVDVASGKPLPVQLRGSDGTDRSNALPVTGTFWQATQPVSGTFWQATQPVSGTVTATNTHLSNFGAGEYETVAASQTAQVLGATGAAGDYISGILVVPATTSPGNVLLLDNATSITVFAGGASSVSNLVPFFIPLGMISVSGAWKITTGSNVSCIGIGNFT